MNIYETFSFLVNDYKLKHEVQTFNIGRGWIVLAHSFYNTSGCFTIHSMESRGELEFYYSRYFSNDRNKLYEKIIDIYSVEKETWDKHGKIGFFPNIFFWFSNRKILKVSAEVVKAQIKKNKEFFGIKI